jgi:hypothetical protein
MTNKRSVASRFMLIGRYPFLSGSPELPVPCPYTATIGVDSRRFGFRHTNERSFMVGFWDDTRREFSGDS